MYIYRSGSNLVRCHVQYLLLLYKYAVIISVRILYFKCNTAATTITADTMFLEVTKNHFVKNLLGYMCVYIYIYNIYLYIYIKYESPTHFANFHPKSICFPGNTLTWYTNVSTVQYVHACLTVRQNKLHLWQAFSLNKM